MPRAARRLLSASIASMLAIFLATPCASQVIVGSFLSPHSSSGAMQKSLPQLQHIKFAKKKSIGRTKHKGSSFATITSNREPYNDPSFAKWIELNLKALQCGCSWYNSQIGDIYGLHSF